MIEPHILADVDPEYLAAFQQVYNIIDVFQFVEFDHDYTWLIQRLLSSNKKIYDAKDRIIVVHFDSDYYIRHEIGLTLTNFFSVWRQLDIPLHTMLLYTNHIGLGREVDTLCRLDHVNDRPTVIETIINPGNYLSQGWVDEPNINADAIQYHGLAMMANPRSHRFAMYNHLSDLGDKIAFSLKGTQS
jgi:hypothetical protein